MSFLYPLPQPLSPHLCRILRLNAFCTAARLPFSRSRGFRHWLAKPPELGSSLWIPFPQTLVRTREWRSLLWLCVYVFFALYFVHVVGCILPGILGERFSLSHLFQHIVVLGCVSSLVSAFFPRPSQLPVSQRESLLLNQKFSERS